MDSKAFVTNSSGSVSGSPPSFTIRASPSYDSDIDNENDNDFQTAIKDNNRKKKNNSSSSSSSSSSVSSSDEDGGFVSGEEEFETASERPFVAEPDDETTLEKYMEGDGVDVPLVEPSVALELPVRPIAKVSEDVDDDDEEVVDEVVESPKVRVRGSEGVGENGVVVGDNSIGAGVGNNGKLVLDTFVDKIDGEEVLVRDGEKVLVNSSLSEDVTCPVEGLSFIKLKGENGKRTEIGLELDDDKFENAEHVHEVAVENLTSGGEFAEVSLNVVGSGNDELAEANGVRFTTEGDPVVEEIHVDVLGPGVVAIGASAETEEPAAKSVEVPDVEGVTHEVEGVKLMPAGDSVMEEIHVDISGSGTVFVGGMDKSEESDIKGVEAPIIEAEQPVVESVEVYENRDKTIESYDDVKSKELESLEPVTEISSIEKEDSVVVEKVAAAAGSTMPEDDQDIKIDVADGVKTLEVDVGDHDKPEEVIDTEANSEAELKESSVVVAVSAADFVDGDKVPIIDGEMKVDDDDEISNESHAPASTFGGEVRIEDENDTEGSVSEEETNGMIFGSSEAAKQFLEELEQESIGAETSRDNSGMIDGQTVTDSDEEEETDEDEGDGKELFDSAALAALLKAATGGGGGSDGGSITITSQDGSRLFSVERPAGLGSSLRAKPALRLNRPNIFSSSGITAGGDSDNNLSEDEKKKLESIQQLRVKFLRLVHRLGHSTEDSVAAQVLYRLGLVGRTSNLSFSLETAKRTAFELETEGKDDLSFSLNILVLGKTGVGKSATINSIFGEEKARIDAFEPTTDAVKEVTGVVDGVKIRVIDTPGLRSSVMEQGTNRKILASVKKITKKFPPDIVLYVDRLDTQTRDLNDLPLLRTISGALGPSIWRSAIVTLTHAASAPPDGPSGTPLSYEVFVAQRSHVVQQSVGQAVGDLRLMNPTLMNPVSLVENHPSCRKNRDGQKVLPNGQTWRPQLLLLCYSMKILSEASLLSKPQDPFDPKKLFGFRMRSPPLPYLLSWLLQSRTHPKLSPDQGGDNGDSDVDLDDLSESEGEEEEDEYDQLPPFKPLRKSQIAKLNKEQRKAYFEEYDYRVKLLQKKQWREELRRMKESKKKGNVAEDDYGYLGDDADQDGAPAAMPVPLPDMVLPPSFDCDNPAYRYRFLEPTSQFLARPVLDTHGWDHDCGYDGVNLEQSLAIAGRFPAAVAVQLTKDKKEFSIHLDSSLSAKHGENGSSMAGFDIQNVGKQLAYIVRGETKFKNFKKNKTAAGVSVTFLGENIVPGFKIEDQIALGKHLVLVGSTGTVRSQGDAAYGANLEVRLKEADFPIGQDQSSLGLSLVKWRGDLALGANLQSQFSVGRAAKMAVRVGLNNKLSGQITVRTSSADQLQIALVGILPVAIAIYKSIWPGVSENYSIY